MLTYVIALRLYPPVPNNAKIAIRDTVLPRGGGPEGRDPIIVPKDAPVIYTVYALHRRYDLFGDDADDFRPERWENQRYTWVSDHSSTMASVLS